MARIMGNIFYSLGVLPSNRLLEVTRKDLVEGYVGQTATKTARVVKRAVGGVFFIDEAYSLMGDNFGQGIRVRSANGLIRIPVWNPALPR